MLAVSVLFCLVVFTYFVEEYMSLWQDLPLHFRVLHLFMVDPSGQETLGPHMGHVPAIRSSRMCKDGAVSISGCVYGAYMEGPLHVWVTCHYTSAQTSHGHRRAACKPCTCTQNETSSHDLQKQQPPHHLTFIDIYGWLLNKLWHYITQVESRPAYLKISS